MKILFILKKREDLKVSDISSYSNMSTGLFNSASFNVDMINDQLGIQSKIVIVNDNNDIDREVQSYSPTHVVIEALWVVPSKFDVLEKLHPTVKWIVRLHSETPFLANEGIAFDWIGDYVSFKNVYVGANAPRMLNELKEFIPARSSKFIYLPNYFKRPPSKAKKIDKTKEFVDICCFGAIRPMKNHLAQAIAAVAFAESVGKKLRFHINGDRIEMKGAPVMNNLIGMFSHITSRGHELVSHDWAPRDEFLVTCASMDIGMQVSFTESFNIVAADLVSVGVPVVTSNEIPWAEMIFCASPTHVQDIVKKMGRIYATGRLNNWTNKYLLDKYTRHAASAWKAYIQKEIKNGA